MFTAPYCGHCQVFHNKHKSKLVAKGIPIYEFDMTDPAIHATYSKTITSLPTFVFYDPDNGGDWKTSEAITGSADGETIINRYNEITAPELLPGNNPGIEAIQPPVYVAPPVIVPPPPREIIIPQTQSRYIQWPGWGTIDLETYGHGCNCSMCRTIRGMQQNYRNQQRYQSDLTDDQQPCPQELVDSMLDAMDLKPTDVIADLGCGDGRILISAAKRGVRGIGVELDRARAEQAIKLVDAAGLSHMIQIILGDARQFDMSKATAITAYLYPPLLEELAPRMQGARVVASPYHEIPGLKMDKTRHGDVWLYHSQVEVASID